ncbi:MAG: hypothetical protein LBV00_10310, partial [Propionibacteriaceae bacterium]|nr:hypothetical protein [Propionibacteriaceae bacterium]
MSVIIRIGETKNKRKEPVMGLIEGGLTVEKFGSLLLSKVGVIPIKEKKVVGFSKDGVAPADWEHACFLSDKTLPTPSKQGGELTMLGTLQRRNTGAADSDTIISMLFTSVQTDAATLDKMDALRRGGEDVGAFFITEAPDGKRRGCWWAAAAFSITDMPSMQ